MMVIIKIIDNIYTENMYCNFGELATNVKDAIDKMSANKKNSIKIENLEDMQRALDLLPDMKLKASNV